MCVGLWSYSNLCMCVYIVYKSFPFRSQTFGLLFIYIYIKEADLQICKDSLRTFWTDILHIEVYILMHL